MRRLKSYILITLILLLTFAVPSVHAAECLAGFTDDFSAPAVNPRNWSFWSLGTIGHVDNAGTANKLLITKVAAKDGANKGSGISTSITYSGDFRTEVDITALQAKFGIDKSSAEATLAVEGDAQNKIAISFVKDGKGTYVSGYSLHEGILTRAIDYPVSPDGKVKMIIVRKSDTAELYINFGTQDLLVHVFNNVFPSPAKISIYSWLGGNGGQDIVATFSNFSISCATNNQIYPTSYVTSYPVTADFILPSNQSQSWLIIGAGGLVSFMGFAILLVSLIRRHEDNSNDDDDNVPPKSKFGMSK